MCGVSHALFLHLCGESGFLCSQAIGDKTPSHCYGKITVQLVVYQSTRRFSHVGEAETTDPFVQAGGA